MPLDDDIAGIRWELIGSAEMPVEELEQRAAVDARRAIDELRDTIDIDDDLTNAERATIFAFLDRKAPELLQRARADAKKAHARLQH
jgi:hypothetical protein